MTFEKIRRYSRYHADGPVVAISRYGQFRFNTNFTKKISSGGESLKYNLFYDKENMIIKLSPTKDKIESFTISIHVSNRSSYLSCRSFLKQFKLLHGGPSKRYSVSIKQNGEILIDLNKELK